MSISHASPPPSSWYSGAVARRLQPRRPLSDIALTGDRVTWHAATRWLIGGLVSLVALLVATEQHQVCESWGSCDASDWGAAHTLVSDLGGMPFLLLAVIAALQLAGYRRRMLAGLLTAIGSAVMAVYLLLSVALVHLLSKVEGGGSAAGLSLILVVVCLFQIVLEPVLAARARRDLEAADPHVPRAAVVA